MSAYAYAYALVKTSLKSEKMASKTVIKSITVSIVGTIMELFSRPSLRLPCSVTLPLVLGGRVYRLCTVPCPASAALISRYKSSSESERMAQQQGSKVP